jgi:ornithine carbamoyltransferase
MARHLVSLTDWEPEEIKEMLELAATLKKRAAEGTLEPVLENRSLALLFEKSSMRTRVSFEVAMTQLGGNTVYLSKDDVNLGVREPIKDGSRVMARYVDVVAARTKKHSSVVELARWSDIPVINALSDLYHPCQALGDLQTITEAFGELDGLKVAWVGDSNNVARSLAVICSKLGVDYSVASPAGYQFDSDFTATVEEWAGASGAAFEVSDSLDRVLDGSDVVYTDTWVSMGQEAEAEARRRAFEGYRVDEDLLKKAGPDARVMHCLPAYRGEEITDEVIEGPRSLIFDQAENRLHAERALLHSKVERG